MAEKFKPKSGPGSNKAKNPARIGLAKSPGAVARIPKAAKPTLGKVK